MRILLSAYACRPNAGSEPAQGWGWATHLARRGHEVHVLVAKRNQESVEAGLREQFLSNLCFSYVPGCDWANRWEGLHYALWQRAALKTARKLCSKARYDIVHHVTYASIHVPSQLWRLGIPMVFGPVGGGQTAPSEMLSYFGAGLERERLRTVLTRALTASPLHRLSLARTGFVLTANSDTLSLVRAMGCNRATLMCDTGISDSYFAQYPRDFGQRQGTVKLLWVGRFLPRKALPLALDALQRLDPSVTLTLAGDGLPPETVYRMIRARNLQDRVFWKGSRLSWNEVRTAYAEHDAFLFTSLRDSFGSQVLEAMAMALPVITLDLHGAHDFVPANAAKKVRVGNLEETLDRLVATIREYAMSSTQEKNEMSRNAWNFAKTLSWSARTAFVEDLYRKLCSPTASRLEQTINLARASA